MKQNHVENIKRTAYWEVNFRPLGEIRETSLVDAKNSMQKSAVSIRGWDFPHFSFKDNEEGGEDFAQDFYQNWTDWRGFKELFRIYRSRQFLYLSALHEDTGYWEPEIIPGQFVLYVPALYSIFEYVEFLHRLAAKEFYKDGAELRISLKNVGNRILSAGRGRVPFFDRFRFDGPDLRINRRCSQADIVTAHRSISVDLCVEFLDRFGFGAGRAQISDELEKFYDRRFG